MFERSRGELAVVLALGLALSVWFTWPAWTAGEVVLLGSEDSEAHSGAWVVWWGQQAMLETFAAPLWAEGLNAPKGRAVHCLPLMDAIWTLPLHGRVHAAVVHNLIASVHVLLAALGAWVFLRRQGAGRWTALPGVAAFAATPTFVGALASGPIESFGIAWLPLTLVAVLEALKRGGALRLGIAAFALGGCFLANPYFFVFAGMTLAWLAPLEQRGRPWKPWLLRAAVIGAGAAVMMVPQILAIEMSPGLSPRDSDAALEAQLRATVLSYDLGSFLLPVDTWLPALKLRRVYLGLGLLGLAATGLGRPGWRRWALFFVLGLFFAMGAELRVGGWTLGTSPLALTLARIPPFDSISHPFRIAPLLVLALGLLAALGLSRLEGPWRQRASLAALGLVLVDLLLLSPGRGPLPTAEAAAPAFYEQLEAAPGELVVLDLFPEVGPPNPARALIFQPVHRQHLVVGLLPPDPPWSDNALIQLAQWNSEERFPHRRQQLCQDARDSREIGLRYVVGHLDESGANPRLEQLLPCGFETVWQDAEVTVLDLDAR